MATYEIVTIAPELAGEWLDTVNTRNRHLRSAVVNAYARDMSTGSWRDTGDPIRFSRSGVLLDGQHRLAAMVKAQVTLEMLVVRDLDDDAQQVMDTGARRTAADALHLRGETDTAILAGTIRRIILWERRSRSASGQQAMVTMSEINRFLEEHPEVRDSAVVARQTYRPSGISPGVLGLCHWLFSRIDDAECKEFFARLADGAELPLGHPVLVLRERMRRYEGSRRSDMEPVAFVIKAWNAVRSSTTMRLLRFSPGEDMPVPR